jgi:hypothetical protein
VLGLKLEVVGFSDTGSSERTSLSYSLKEDEHETSPFVTIPPASKPKVELREIRGDRMLSKLGHQYQVNATHITA